MLSFTRTRSGIDTGNVTRFSFWNHYSCGSHSPPIRKLIHAKKAGRYNEETKTNATLFTRLLLIKDATPVPLCLPCLFLFIINPFMCVSHCIRLLPPAPPRPLPLCSCCSVEAGVSLSLWQRYTGRSDRWRVSTNFDPIRSFCSHHQTCQHLTRIIKGKQDSFTLFSSSFL